jgi:hypothetical protein
MPKNCYEFESNATFVKVTLEPERAITPRFAIKSSLDMPIPVS